MDITDTLAPKSEQMDAIDLHHSGPRVFTVEKVTAGAADQPVHVHLLEFPRAWRPSKSMRRVLADCWGKEASEWTGHRLKLWCDPRVAFGGQEVGGIRILAVSHIDKPKSVPLIVTRGKTAMYKVDPLVEDPPPLVSSETLAALRVLFDKRGIAEESRFPGVVRIIGRKPIDIEAITEDEAQQVIVNLEAR